MMFDSEFEAWIKTFPENLHDRIREEAGKHRARALAEAQEEPSVKAEASHEPAHAEPAPAVDDVAEVLASIGVKP